MTWAKLDDGFPDHPKVAGLSDLAFRLHVRAICYSARMLTDGRVPMAVVKGWIGDVRPRLRPVSELIEAGLWTRRNNAIRVHDFLDYNPSHAQIMARRRADSERKRSGVGSDSKRPDPARPLTPPKAPPRGRPKAKPRVSEASVPTDIADHVRRVVGREV